MHNLEIQHPHGKLFIDMLRSEAQAYRPDGTLQHVLARTGEEIRYASNGLRIDSMAVSVHRNIDVSPNRWLLGQPSLFERMTNWRRRATI